VVKVKVIKESYFAMELQGPGRHLSGNKNYFQGRVERELVLTSHDVSSLVVDRLCDQERGKTQPLRVFTLTSQRERSTL